MDWVIMYSNQIKIFGYFEVSRAIFETTAQGISETQNFYFESTEKNFKNSNYTIVICGFFQRMHI